MGVPINNVTRRVVYAASGTGSPQALAASANRVGSPSLSTSGPLGLV